MAAHLRKHGGDLVGKLVGPGHEHASYPTEVDGRKEVGKVDVQYVPLSDMSLGIGDYATLVDEPVDAVSGRVNGLKHLVELTLKDLKSCLRGANPPDASRALSDQEGRVLLRWGNLVDVIN